MLNYFKLSNHMYLQFFQRVSLKWYHSIGYLLSENAKPTFLFKQQQNKLFKLLRFLEKGCFWCFFFLFTMSSGKLKYNLETNDSSGLNILALQEARSTDFEVQVEAFTFWFQRERCICHIFCDENRHWLTQRKVLASDTILLHFLFCVHKNSCMFFFCFALLLGKIQHIACYCDLQVGR